MARHRRTLEEQLADSFSQNRASAGVTFSTPAMTPVNEDLILPNAVSWEKLHPEVQADLTDNAAAVTQLNADLDNLNTSLGQAQTDAVAAKQAAATADQKAVNAASAASAAATAAQNAQSSADAASTAASTADGKAVAAQTKADQASTDAAAAKTAGDNAAAAASVADDKAVAAQTKADQATTDAANAKSAADAAATAASTADGKAVAAQTKANQATTDAANAKTAADNAATAASTADGKAVTAQSTANGKSKVTYSTSPASGANTAGDVWFQKDANGVITGQWEGAGGTTWAARTLSSSVIAALDVGKLTGGTISANLLNATDIRAKFIAAGKITAADITAATLTSASGIFGTMDASVINAGTINAARLVAADIRAKFLTAGKITASDIATGSLTSASGIFGDIDASVINVGTLDVARLNGGDVRAAVLTAGKIAATDMVTGTLTSASGVFGTVDASVINAGTLNAARLNAADIRSKFIEAGKITAADITAGTLTSASGIFGTLDASILNAGTLNAARIAGGSIAAGKLIIGSGQNCLTDPAFAITEINNARIARSTGTWTLGTPTATGIRSMSHTTTGTNDQFNYAPIAPAAGTAGNGINVEAGQKWMLNVDVETDISAGVRWNVYAYKADGTMAYTSLSPYNTAVGKRNLSYVYTIPAGVIAMDLALACNTTGVVWTVYGTGLVALQSDATLIQDGAVQTNHMIVNTINGDRIAVNSLNADRIVANSITAGKLSATAIDGKTITGATVIGGEVKTSDVSGAVIARMGPTATWDGSAGKPGIGFAKVGSTAEQYPAGMYSNDGTDVHLVQSSGGVAAPIGSIRMFAPKGAANRVAIDSSGGSGDIMLTGNTTVNGEGLEMQHAEFYCAGFGVTGNAQWDIGPQTIYTTSDKVVNNSGVDQFCQQGPYNGSISITKDGWYQFTALVIPRSNPASCWLSATRNGNDKKGQVMTNGFCWESYVCTPATWMKAGDYMRFPFVSTNNIIIDSYTTVTRMKF